MMIDTGSVRSACAVAVLMLVVGLGGCTTGNNVQFARHSVLKLPNVLPHSSERFGLNLWVVNPKKNKSYEPNAFRVKVESLHRTDFHSDCQRTTYIPVTGSLAADGGKFVVEDYFFDDEQYAGDPCVCRRNQCSGLVTITLQYAGSGNKVSGVNTKLHISWDEQGNLEDVDVN
ncbi:MAG: hypothetical protein CMJ18_00290 [Phycisphaeraceae bacterium]|nr:hypothetical protein [Phycisphaeraceae bacterium]